MSTNSLGKFLFLQTDSQMSQCPILGNYISSVLFPYIYVLYTFDQFYVI